LSVGFERCEDKIEKDTPKFVPGSNYNKEEESLKPTKPHYPSNPEPSFNPKSGVKKNTSNPSEEVYICMFYGRAGHLDEFCFQHNRMEKRRVNYARNSYHDEFTDFPPQFSSRALSHFSHGPNYRSYGFALQESSLMPGSFGVDPRSHRGVPPPRRHSFPARGVYSKFEPVALTVHAFHNVVHVSLAQMVREVQRIVKTLSGHMVKCLITNIFLTNPNTKSSTFSHSM
jgi:hypothetical protein